MLELLLQKRKAIDSITVRCLNGLVPAWYAHEVIDTLESQIHHIKIMMKQRGLVY